VGGRAPRQSGLRGSADAKTSIQARIGWHESLVAAPQRTKRVEFEYDRGGALQYLAGWDVHRAKVFGRCEVETGIVPFGRLVDQVMSTEPYASARRVRTFHSGPGSQNLDILSWAPPCEPGRFERTAIETYGTVKRALLNELGRVNN
jgi:hypothetical protein